MSTSKSELLMRQFERVNSAKQLSTDWDYSQSSSLADSDETEERKLAVLIEWLNTILPDLKLPPKASVEELRECLADGTVLLQILRKVKPRSFTKELEGVLEAEIVSPSQNVQLFLDNIDERGIPKFEMEDLEKGSMKRVVDCLLSIRVRYPTGRNNFSSTNGRMTRSGSLREFSPYQSLHLGTFSSSLSSPGAERQPLYSESKFQQFLRTSPALSESSAAWMHHAGHRFHEVFQVRQGRYADLSPSKISEMMKSTSLDNAPTQSLLSVVNGILDESIDRKNGEIPHRVACLLRKVVQEIERRISTQAEHLRTQNNLFKAREEKYQSRIRVLETLASGTGEQPAVIIDQLPPIKGVKVKMEEKSKVNEEIAKLMREKEHASIELARLRQELETTKTIYDDMVKLMRQKDENKTSLKLPSSRQEQEQQKKTNIEISALQQEVAAGKKELNQIVESVREADQQKNEQNNAEVLALKQELASTRKELDGIVGSMKQNDQIRVGDDVVRLAKEKEEMSLQVVALKQELERVSRQGSVDKDVDVVRLVKEKEEMSLKISSLQQELETSRRQGNNDADLARLMKENEEMSLKISSLQQEHEEMVRLMKEKDQKGHDQLLKLQQETDSTKRELDDMARLVKEKDQANLRLAMSMQELELANKAQEQKYLQLEAEAKTVADGFETRLKEVSSQLSRSKAKLESDQQSWSKKQNSVLQTVDLQFHSLHELRFSSTSIKQEVLQVQQDYTEKFLSLGVKFKTLVDASENYYLVLAENRRLFNELQDLRGNIRVYCRVRPFLPGQSSTNKSIVDHIGDKGELVVGNPAKAGKDGRKLFRFNKVYGPEATQAEVYLDTQPLVQSVLDGYNVCIFAYGQTGSGKTYTMLGPNGAKEEEWGVNYRALKDLFNMSKGRSDSITYEVGVQMVEIYNEQVRDLLTNDPHKKYPFFATFQIYMCLFEIFMQDLNHTTVRNKKN
ncbi:Kinesin-like protein KIN-14P [Linum grandiflorum]